MDDADDWLPMTRAEEIRSRARTEHWRQHCILRDRARSLMAEAMDHRWHARGCPLDRSGILGVSLLDPPTKIAAALEKAVAGEQATSMAPAP